MDMEQNTVKMGKSDNTKTTSNPFSEFCQKLKNSYIDVSSTCSEEVFFVRKKHPEKRKENRPKNNKNQTITYVFGQRSIKSISIEE